jgi:hypothetical protein
VIHDPLVRADVEKQCPEVEISRIIRRFPPIIPFVFRASNPVVAQAQTMSGTLIAHPTAKICGDFSFCVSEDLASCEWC